MIQKRILGKSNFLSCQLIVLLIVAYLSQIICDDCFQSLTTPRVIGGEVGWTSFECGEVDSFTSNIIIGGSTTDQNVSGLSGEKPIIISILPNGNYKWKKVIDQAGYFSVTALSIHSLDQSKGLIVALDSKDIESLFIIQLSKHDGTLLAAHKTPSAIRGFIPTDGLLFENDGNVYLCGTHYQDKWMSLKYMTGSIDQPSKFYILSAQTQTEANVIVPDYQMYRYFVAGLAKDSNGNQNPSIALIRSIGQILQVQGLNLATTNALPYSVQKLAYHSTSSSNNWLASCSSNNQNVVISKFNVDSNQSSFNHVKSRQFDSMTACLQVVPTGSNGDQIYFLVSNQNLLYFGFVDFSLNRLSYVIKSYPSNSENKLKTGFFYGTNTKAYYIGSMIEINSGELYNQPVGFLQSTLATDQQVTITYLSVSPTNITGHQISNSSFQAIYNTFQLTELTPDLVSQIETYNITPSTMTNIDYTVKGSMITFKFNPFSINITCDDLQFKYSIAITPEKGLDVIKFFESNRTILIYTTDNAYIGPYEVQVKGMINNFQYKTTSFTINIEDPCSTAIIKQKSSFVAKSHQYQLGSISQVISYDIFESDPLGCPITYTVTKINGPSSSNYQMDDIDITEKTLAVSTNDNTALGSYSIKVHGMLENSVTQSVFIDILIGDECLSDIITPVNQVEFDYFIDSNQELQLFELNYPRSDAGCGTVNYYLVNSATNSTADVMFRLEVNDTGFTNMVVQTIDMQKRGTYILRIIANSTSTYTPTVLDDFIVHIKDNCSSAIITSYPIELINYTIGDSQLTITYAGWTIDKEICGPITYAKTNDSAIPSQGFTFDPSNFLISLQTTNTSLAGYYLISILGTSKYGAKSETQKFTLIYTNPCLTAEVITPYQPDLTFAINQEFSSELKYFTFNISSVDCGGFIYQINYQNGSDLDASIFNYDSPSNMLTAFTDDINNEMTQVIRLYAYPVNYPDSTPYHYDFNLTIEINCTYDTIQVSQNISQLYSVFDDQIINLDFGQYFSHKLIDSCPEVSIYKCHLDYLGNPCPLFVQIEEPNGSLSIFTQNKESMNNYTLIIEGSNGLINKEQYIFLEIKCDCRCATIEYELIQPGVYDINNGTQTYTHQNLSWSNNMETDCPTVYQIINAETGAQLGDNVIAVDNTNLLIVNVSTATTVKDYNLIMKAYAGSEFSVELQFTINITDVCPDAEYSSSIIDEQFYTISSSTYEIQFDPWSSIPTFCSQFTYSAQMSDGSSLKEFITFYPENRTFQIQTSDIDDKGTYKIAVIGSSFGKDILTMFNLTLKVSCSQNQLNGTDIGIPSFVQYDISTPQYILRFKDFTQLSIDNCGPIVYSAMYNISNYFPFQTNVVKFDSTYHQFTIFTQDQKLNNTLLQVQLTATIGSIYSTIDFDILIIFNCYVSQLTPSINDVQNLRYKTLPYTIYSGQQVIQFDKFAQYENCGYNVAYSLINQDNSSLPYFIDLSQLQQRKILVQSENMTDAYNATYNFRIIVTVYNPNDTVQNNIDFKLNLKTINYSPPVFVQPLQDIYLENTQQALLNFPQLFDRDMDQVDQVLVDLGQAQDFITGTYPNFQIQPTLYNFGIFNIKVTVKDLNPNPLTAIHNFKIFVSSNIDGQTNPNQNIPQGVSDIKKISSTLSAYIRSIDMNGLVTVIFNQNLATPLNYTGFQNETLILRIRDNEGRLRNDLQYTWKIENFKSNTMKIQVNFKQKKKISTNQKDQLEINFRLNQRFVSEKDGLLIKRDYSISRNIPRQLYDDEMTQILQKLTPIMKTTFSSLFYGTLAINLLIFLQMLYIFIQQ
eukprot:403370486